MVIFFFDLKCFFLVFLQYYLFRNQETTFYFDSVLPYTIKLSVIKDELT